MSTDKVVKTTSQNERTNDKNADASKTTNDSVHQTLPSTPTSKIQENILPKREIKLANILQPRTLVPITFTWDNKDSREVFLVGDWNRWTEAIPLVYVPEKGVFGVKIFLPPGRFQYKYIVDLVPKYDDKRPYIKDAKGNANNIVDVKSLFTCNIFVKKFLRIFHSVTSRTLQFCQKGSIDRVYEL